MNRSFLKILLVIFWALGALLPAAAQPTTYNTTLFDKIDPAPTGGSWRYSGVYGYVAPNGREYAILGGHTGTYFIDVTEKPLKQIAFFPGRASNWREIKTYRNYAYVVTEGGGGLQIFDLAKLPASVELVRTDSTLFDNAHTISQEGDYIYVHGTGPGAGANGGTLIFDVSQDPVHPTLVGKWTGRYVHDATVRNDTLYAAAINDGRLDIVYLGADRRQPEFVTSIRYPGAGTHNADLTTDGSYVMTTDEVGTTPKTLKVWDIRDKDNITKVADYTPAPGEIIHNVHTLGSLAFVSWYTAGTRIIDISDPTDPVEVGFYDTFNGAYDFMAGNWETHPYLPSGKILSSDIQTGLYVFTFDNPGRGSIRGTVRDAVTGDPIPGAVIEIDQLGRKIVADAEGHYRFAAGRGSFAFVASSRDYDSFNGALTLTAQEGELDIPLNPHPMSSFSLNVVDDETGQPLPRFSFEVVERGDQGMSAANPRTLRLPLDSTYTVHIGAWGYLPEKVSLFKLAENPMTIRLRRGYSDDATLDLGWSYSAPFDEATSGYWERDTMIGLSFQLPGQRVHLQPALDNTPSSNDRAFFTEIGEVGDYAGMTAVENGGVTLTSPEMDLTLYSNPVLSAAVWLTKYPPTLPDTATVGDTLYLLLSNDGGDSWTTLERYTGTFNEWRALSFHLKERLPITSRMMFRMTAMVHRWTTLLEAGLDDFTVAEAVPSGVAETGAGDDVRVVVSPNPMTERGTIEIGLAEPHASTRLELFDLLGRRVALLHEGAMHAGNNAIMIDARMLDAGRYTWHLTVDGGRARSGQVTVVR